MQQAQTSGLTPLTLPSRGETLIRHLLEELGENSSREGLAATPQRVWRSLSYLTVGYGLSAEDAVGDAIFEEAYDEMVVVRDSEFYSLCEHHMLPFFGRVHVGYVPDGRIVGLSKIPRLIDVFAHRLQVQERLTMQIADALEEQLRPKGVGVVIEASHLCTMMRGVQRQHAQTATSAMRGIFKDDARTRKELFDHLDAARR